LLWALSKVPLCGGALPYVKIDLIPKGREKGPGNCGTKLIQPFTQKKLKPEGLEFFGSVFRYTKENTSRRLRKQSMYVWMMEKSFPGLLLEKK